MNIISKFLLIILLFLLIQTKSYSQALGDSTEIIKDSGCVSLRWDTDYLQAPWLKPPVPARVPAGRQVNRLTSSSFVAVPFIWFIMGINIGIINLYIKESDQQK